MDNALKNGFTMDYNFYSDYLFEFVKKDFLRESKNKLSLNARILFHSIIILACLFLYWLIDSITIKSGSNVTELKFFIIIITILSPFILDWPIRKLYTSLIDEPEFKYSNIVDLDWQKLFEEFRKILLKEDNFGLLQDNSISELFERYEFLSTIKTKKENLAELPHDIALSKANSLSIEYKQFSSLFISQFDIAMQVLVADILFFRELIIKKNLNNFKVMKNFNVVLSIENNLITKIVYGNWFYTFLEFIKLINVFSKVKLQILSKLEKGKLQEKSEQLAFLPDIS
jgi:hypothetical protein